MVAHDELNPLADSLVIELSYIRHDPLCEKGACTNTHTRVLMPGFWRANARQLNELLAAEIIHCRQELEKEGSFEA
jgi:hypothetical protein